MHNLFYRPRSGLSCIHLGSDFSILLELSLKSSRLYLNRYVEAPSQLETIPFDVQTFKHAAMALKDEYVTTTHLTVSRGQSILETIQDALNKYSLNCDEPLQFDYQLLSQQEVLLVTTTSKYIDPYTHALTQAGFKPVILDVESYALERFHHYIQDEIDLYKYLDLAPDIDAQAIRTQLPRLAVPLGLGFRLYDKND